MVGRPGRYQPRFVAGQIDTLLQANTDEQIYAKAASQMLNARVLPQGGFSARAGLQKIDRVRNQLAAVAFTGTALPLKVAALNGQATVATFALSGATQISCIDLEAFGAALPGGAAPAWTAPATPLVPAPAGSVTVQTSPDGVTWTQLDATRGLSDALRNRRFAAPPGEMVTCSQIQVIVNEVSAGGVDFYLAGVAAWVETSAVSPARLRPFAESVGNVYDFVFTAGNCEVYSSETGARAASIPIALTPAQVPTFKNAQQFDTMLVTHQQFAPIEIVWAGSDAEWDISNAIWTDIPLYNFHDTTYSNGAAEVLVLTFVNCDTQLTQWTPAYPSGGINFAFTLNGNNLPPFQLLTDTKTRWQAIAAQLQAEIIAAPGMSAGVVVAVSTWQVNNVQLTVTFGGTNAGTVFALSGVVTNKRDAAITAATDVSPLAGGEPIMSALRGWPGACCIFQQRFLLGGFAGAPNAIVASQAGNYYMLNTLSQLSTGAMLIVLDTLGNETILDLHVGRTLGIFTSRAEYWMEPGALVTTSPPLIVYSSNNGIAPTVSAFENEGVTIYVHANRGALLEFVYDYARQNYDSNNISVVSSSLIQGVIDGAMRPQEQNVDTADLFLVLQSGDAVALSLLRTEQIKSYWAMQTDGNFVAADVNADFQANFVVARQVGGATVQFLEALISPTTLDCAETFAVVAGAASISGLSDFEGATVWAYVDGYYQGPFMVTGGTIALEFPAMANGSAIVGRWTAPLVATLPTPRDIGQGMVMRRPARVHTVRAQVVASTSLAIGANGDGPYDVALQFFGGAADTPPSAAPFSGWTLCEGIPGFSEDGIVTVSQLRPGALNLIGLVVEVDK